MKKILLSLSASVALLNAATNDELLTKIEKLEREMAVLKADQAETSGAVIEELGSLKEAIYAPEGRYESFSSLGAAASRVYHSKSDLSIGGYGEYKLKKYFDYKNYDDETANDTRNKLESNIVRFVPYIGYKFSDRVIMNTEIEFEDGGARSDGEENYKYAIVEFSYLDFLIDEKYALRAGHLLVPMGLTNLNHEPIAFLTAERPTVETLIIPSTWHTNGALIHGRVGEGEYYAGAVTMPDPGQFTAGRFIQQGRQGARQFTDDFGFVGRYEQVLGDGVSLGGSLFYGAAEVLEETRPGASTGNTPGVKVSVGIAELHGSYKKEGWHIQGLAAFGGLGGDSADLPQNTETSQIPTQVNGQYLTAGYDLFSKTGGKNRLFVFGEVERLDLDVKGEDEFPDNNRFMELGGGLAYYPDPRVVIKGDYTLRDYADAAKLADESAATLTLGFIF